MDGIIEEERRRTEEIKAPAETVCVARVIVVCFCLCVCVCLWDWFLSRDRIQTGVCNCYIRFDWEYDIDNGDNDDGG